MPTPSMWRINGFEVSLLRGVSADRLEHERALVGSGWTLPLPHRAAWALMQEPGQDTWLISVADARGTPCGAVAVHVAPSRALPGHLLLRCERFGPGLAPHARTAALEALALLARAERRVLRLSVETFAADSVDRDAVETTLRAIGFTPVEPPRCYQHTLLVSLDGDVEGIFGSLHATARRHIRAAAKHPVVVKPVTDRRFFDRLDEISRETYARTGGTYLPPDWGKVVALGEREPDASRLVGLFRTDREGPDGLLAFAWGCGHGDHVHYSRAGSTRATDLKIPLMYPIVWDLVQWAKGSGARYFDFGGITMGSHQSADPLGGISDFKRYFAGQAVEVGAEWALEPRAIQAHAAKMVSATSSFVSRVLARA